MAQNEITKDEIMAVFPTVAETMADALGWGAGVIAHGWCAFGKRRPRTPAQEAPAAKQVTKSKSERHPAPKRSSGTPRSKSPKRGS